MTRKKLIAAALILPALLAAGILVLQAGGKVKEPSVAGAFYPADKKELVAVLGNLLSRAEPVKPEGELVALIAPHAGYQYSGAVAASAYHQLKDRKIDTVILIGPSHHAPLKGASIYTSGKMRTPLGDLPIDAALARSLIDERSDIIFSPTVFEREHSLEVQFPFLQTVFRKIRIVPILIGAPTRESFQKLVSGLTKAVRKNPRTIIIASSDLSHYHDYATARLMDRRVIGTVARMSLEELEKALSSGAGEMCGGFPVLITMAVARNLGATHGALLHYANSGDVTGDRSRVVGYAAMGLVRAPLTGEQRRELLSLANKTVFEYVKNGTAPEYRSNDPRLLANGAVFVTINKNGILRGCIGNIQPIMPLTQAVVSNATSASARDPRFTPVTREELSDLQIEVTVLSPLEPLEDVADIRIGTHGLYIINGRNAGILLPQVAEEQKWDVKTFLEQVSNKAGLPAHAWKNSELFTFTADIIR